MLPVAPDVARGVRAALVTLVPFYLAAVLRRPELTWTALGGWLGTLADPGGSRVTRARALVVFAIGGAVLVAPAEMLDAKIVRLAGDVARVLRAARAFVRDGAVEDDASPGPPIRVNPETPFEDTLERVARWAALVAGIAGARKMLAKAA